MDFDEAFEKFGGYVPEKEESKYTFEQKLAWLNSEGHAYNVEHMRETGKWPDMNMALDGIVTKYIVRQGTRIVLLPDGTESKAPFNYDYEELPDHLLKFAEGMRQEIIVPGAIYGWRSQQERDQEDKDRAWKIVGHIDPDNPANLAARQMRVEVEKQWTEDFREALEED